MTTPAEAIEYARDYEGSFQFMLDMRAAVEADRPFSPRMIDAIIRCKERYERAPKTAAASEPATEPGMYRIDEAIFKVQRSESGNLYAKRLVQIGGKRLSVVDETDVHFEFEYAPGAIRALGVEHRLTLDEARAFGIRFGVCCVCGTFLKDADSVRAGIGPVCAKRV